MNVIDFKGIVDFNKEEEEFTSETVFKCVQDFIFYFLVRKRNI